MALIEGIKIDNPGEFIGQAVSGLGQLFKDIRTAITGKEPISIEKQMEIQAKVAEAESILTNATIAVALAEAQSQDKWTSRSRPLFMYVIYVLILSAIPMGVLYAFNPTKAGQIAIGFKAWLDAIPQDFIWLFGAGYLGYGAFRSFDKWKGCVK